MVMAEASLLDILENLRNLPNNWDGYGSRKIQSPALKTVGMMFVMIQVRRLPIPHVSPVPGGGVQLEWENSPYALELEIFPDGFIEFLFVPDDATDNPYWIIRNQLILLGRLSNYARL